MRKSVITAMLAAAAACSLPAGWDAVDARRPEIVVLGELHGTVEGPAVVGDIVCALTRRGERVLVALEQSAGFNSAFQAAWSGDERTFAAAIPVVLHWQGRNDGNGSVAMRDLMLRLHGMRASGARVDVTAFNGARDDAQRARYEKLPGQGGHEAAQAENIAAAAAGAKYDRVLVLVGSLHASRRPVSRRETTFEPMAMHLGADRAMISLQMSVPAGTAWGCQLKPGVVPKPERPITSADIACGSTAVKDQSEGRAPGVHLFEADNGDMRFDGKLVLASSTASPPLLPGARP